jgi:hypothetical protein
MDPKNWSMYVVYMYCTISIDLVWAVTCDHMDRFLTMSNVGVTWASLNFGWPRETEGEGSKAWSGNVGEKS